MNSFYPASQVIMIQPDAFEFNESTFKSNPFQEATNRSVTELQVAAANEFEVVVDTLQKYGILVDRFPSKPNTPDAVFPNNWLSLDTKGRLTLFPMMSTNRQEEYQPSIIEYLTTQYKVSNIHDLRHYSQKGIFLEGTGSLVFDHSSNSVYACISPRTNLELAKKYSEEMGYTLVPFHTTDARGTAIYHTNVMMSVGHSYAVLCLDVIPDKKDRNRILAQLKKNHKKPIIISYSQMSQFAANCILLNTNKGPILFMSLRGFRALSSNQLHQIEQHVPIHPIDIPTIESVGGGSLRCMICENFLKKKSTLNQDLTCY